MPRYAGLPLAVCIVLHAQIARAQTVEVSPFGGYRFGGGFYELVSGESVDVDGAVSAGGLLAVRIKEDLLVEGFVTHQEARFTLPLKIDPGQTRWRVTVDQYQVGGLRELGPGRARPFLTGTLGLTRYESAGDNEFRFAFSAGGGVKLLPAPHIGIRLDGRLYGTVVDADGDSLACTPGICIGSIDATFIWQAEFTAGLVVAF